MATCLRALLLIAIIGVINMVTLASAVTITNDMWKIDYSISKVIVSPGEVLDVTVTVDPIVKTYDFRVEIISSPVQLMRDGVWSFKELPGGLKQTNVFQLKIPENARSTTQYQIDLRSEGYRNPPLFDLLGIWRPHKILFWGEDPTTLDSITTQKSIKLTVT